VKKGTTAVLVLGLGGVLAACGGGGSSVSSPAKKSSKPASTTQPTAATVKVADSALGKILVAANGRTLYAFMPDTATMSACTTANGCAGLWPPLTATGTPTGGTGVTASLLTVLTDANGTQVVYGGHPLYMFANDTAPGDLKGQGFAGNIWHVVSPSGQIITTAVPAAPAATTPTTSAPMGGSGGYGY
jgi:predicted lipoprotein with Yx(FWY)xxD motif